MRTQKLEVGIDNKYQSKENIIVDINEIPCPVAIYFARNDEVVLNRKACEVLGMKENAVFDLTTWMKINPYLRDMLNKMDKDSVTDQKTHVILYNGKHEIINYSFRCFTNITFGKMNIIFFTKASEKYSVASISALYSVKEDLAKLKPYLNRTGKQLHESIMNKYFREENQQLTLDDLVYYEKELRIIQKAFPTLSHREVILCGLLANDMDTKDIATITNRTLDSVFVTIHRINKKLNLLNKKELIDTLKDLVNEKEKNQRVHSVF